MSEELLLRTLRTSPNIRSGLITLGMSENNANYRLVLKLLQDKDPVLLMSLLKLDKI